MAIVKRSLDFEYNEKRVELIVNLINEEGELINKERN